MIITKFIDINFDRLLSYSAKVANQASSQREYRAGERAQVVILSKSESF